MNKTETKIFLNGEEIKCVVVDFDMNGSAIFADDAIHVDREQFEKIEGCGALDALAHGFFDLSKTLRSLPKPKKESWQNNGKRKKPRIK